MAYQQEMGRRQGRVFVPKPGRSPRTAGPRETAARAHDELARDGRRRPLRWEVWSLEIGLALPFLLERSSIYTPPQSSVNNLKLLFSLTFNPKL